MSTLVLAAHPDDEVLGCGGTIARLSQEGEEVYVAILGEGISSRYANRDEADPAALTSLRQTSRAVATFLGAKDLVTLGLPDNRFDTVPLLDIIKIVEGLVTRFAPRMVFTQHGGDLNVDHQVLFRATLTATRPMQGGPVQAVYAYEVASSTEWSFQQFAPAFRPNVFFDIGATLPTKIQAMQMYETEARSFPHPRSAQALRAQAQRWGSVVGCEAAEAFQLVRERR
jgi:LmbE family N-acetylglucosaminyl deacetylase